MLFERKTEILNGTPFEVMMRDSSVCFPIKGNNTNPTNKINVLELKHSFKFVYSVDLVNELDTIILEFLKSNNLVPKEATSSRNYGTIIEKNISPKHHLYITSRIYFKCLNSVSRNDIDYETIQINEWFELNETINFYKSDISDIVIELKIDDKEYEVNPYYDNTHSSRIRIIILVKKGFEQKNYYAFLGQVVEIKPIVVNNLNDLEDGIVYVFYNGVYNRSYKGSIKDALSDRLIFNSINEIDNFYKEKKISDDLVKEKLILEKAKAALEKDKINTENKRKEEQLNEEIKKEKEKNEKTHTKYKEEINDIKKESKEKERNSFLEKFIKIISIIASTSAAVATIIKFI